MTERACLAEVNVEDALLLLSKPRTAVQYVGDKGVGKTTHLLAIAAAIVGSGYVHIPEGQRASVPSGNPVLIDEAQRLSRWQRFRLFRSSIPLVLGTHVDYHQQLRSGGRQVLTIHVDRGTNAERLCKLLNRRIDSVRRTEGKVPSVKLETAQQLLDRFGPDVRAIIRHMYTVFHDLTVIEDV